LPLVSWLKRRRPVARLGSVYLRSRLTQSPLRFAARDLRSAPGVACYRLRGGDVRVCMRHGTPDAYAYDEVFHERIYELPSEVSAAIARLDRAPEIVDLGANVGMFGAFALAHLAPGRIVAYEPDPSTAAVHRVTIEANHAACRWLLHEAAATTADGTVTFLPGRFEESRIAAADEPGTITVTTRNAFADLQQADLAKIDIEGGEWALLADDRLATTQLTAVAIEYHPYLCPDAERTHELAREALARAGFTTAPVARYTGPPGHGMLWAWRTRVTAPTGMHP
jgi:FkbM family methyltransferase